MPNTNDIVKIAADAYHGNVTKYSVGQSQELLRMELVKRNGGSTKLNYKKIRDGECPGLFSLLEETLSQLVVEGLQGDEYFNQLVDFRNIALGDQNLFNVEDKHLYVVAETAEGTQGIRRQRLGGVTQTEIETRLYTVKIYEELNRVLAGRVDFNEMVNDVANSVKQHLLNDIYGLWTSATAADFGGITYFPTAGAYDTEALLDLISHVEAASNGGSAIIIGTKKAVRHLVIDSFGDSGKADLYNLGYVGKFYGTPVVVTPQRHKVGTTDFVMDDNVLTIIAGDDKPIKCVYEGDPIIIMGDPLQNGDLTQEYLYGDRYGLGIVLAGGNSGIGRYTIAA